MHQQQIQVQLQQLIQLQQAQQQQQQQQAQAVVSKHLCPWQCLKKLLIIAFTQSAGQICCLQLHEHCMDASCSIAYCRMR